MREGRGARYYGFPVSPPLSPQDTQGDGKLSPMCVDGSGWGRGGHPNHLPSLFSGGLDRQAQSSDVRRKEVGSSDVARTTRPGVGGGGGARRGTRREEVVGWGGGGVCRARGGGEGRARRELDFREGRDNQGCTYGIFAHKGGVDHIEIHASGMLV